MLRYLTAGESHGKTLIALVDGFPAGVTVDVEPINVELKRRQGGYGRGGRQRIESDSVEVRTGIWRGVTLGSPIALEVVNRDYKLERLDDLARPRPGHADLSGSMKYLSSIRGVLERALHVEAVDGIRPIQHDHRDLPARRFFHHVGDRRRVRVKARTDVL